LAPKLITNAEFKPNKDHVDDLKRCVYSILEKSSYRNFEILIIENDSADDATFLLYKDLQQHSNINVIEYNQKPFNFSKINNFAVGYAHGNVLLFLNNDTEVINSDWLESMLEYAIRPEVGIVGAKLYYPDGSIQHAGMILGISGIAGLTYKHASHTSTGNFYRLLLPQNLSAVTAACLMIKREVFSELGGFDEQYALAASDIDLCLKALSNDYLIVWTPYSELYHHESKTRGNENTKQKRARFDGEIARFRQKWSTELERGDDYYNPNLTLSSENFSINPNLVNASPRIKPGFTKSDK